MDSLQLPTGQFTRDELMRVLDAFPAEISYIDKDDTVRFFNNKTPRYFARPQASLGKNMRVCHPKRVLPMVEQLLDDFKSGRQDKAFFWRSNQEGRFVSISYYALNDEAGAYAGTLEVVQDITDLRQLEGDRDELIYP